MILIHVLAIVVTGLLVLFADEQGLMWMLGRKATLSAKLLTILHRSVSIGLACIILTGAIMVSRDPAYYFANPVFLIKMSFVLVLVVNAFFVGTLSKVATTHAFSDLSPRARTPLLVSAALSVTGWAGALLLGLKLSGWW